jgi:NHLM bacteriocin system ABC transporter ATP-binding protein
MTVAADPDLSMLFDPEAVELSLGGNTPFLLADPAWVWIVRSGRVEVFCVSVVHGKHDGPRFHYLTAEPGAALFGMDLEDSEAGLGLLAVGIHGTELVRVPLQRLRDAPQVARPLIDAWVVGLSKGASKNIIPLPRADVTLAAGDQGALAIGRRARAKREPVWVRALSGTILFIGMEDPWERDYDGVFPLAADSFLQAISGATLSAVDTPTAMLDGSAWAGLAIFHQVIFRCEFFNSRLAAADELNRLQDKAERDRLAKEAAVANLASVLDPRLVPFAQIPTDDPLLAACMVVGRWLDVKIQAPPKPKDGTSVADPLGEIVRASKIRSRRVILKGQWWKEEAAPIVAFIEDGRRPVAIVPRRPGTFELYDPAARTTTIVNGAVAGALAGIAHTFYVPFPDQPLTPMALFRFAMRRNTRDFVRPMLLGLCGGLLGMVGPYFMGLLVDSVIPEADRGQLITLALMMILVGITTASFGIVQQLSVLRLEVKMSGAMQPAMWDHLLGLPVAFFRRYSAGDLAQRMGCIDGMRQVLSGATTTSIMTSIFSMCLLVQMLWYSPPLALVAITLVAVAMLMSTLFAYRKLQWQRPAMKIEGQIAGLVLQLFTGIAKLRMTGAEDRAFAVWAREFAEQKRLAVKAGRMDMTFQLYSSWFSVACSMLIYWSVVYVSMGTASATQRLSAGQFVAFNSAFGAFLMQMLGLASTLMSVLSLVPMMERAQPILSALSEVDAKKVDPGELAGRIDVEHVSFRYQLDGPPILNDVSIHVAAGEFIAIVGPSGSGKSTLIRLLLGLEVPENGSIYYDGRDLALLDVQRLRRRVGVVMQTGRIRPGSIFENIVGSAPLTHEDAWEAARLAGFEDDIKQMPMGLLTVLQQGGATLSGGQRQRLMIARAIVNRPRIMLFDEATSALDNQTQAVVTRSLQDLQATRIAIAHRLSTIVGADRIYVMQAGAIVESGSYAELATMQGVFADLIRRQIA